MANKTVENPCMGTGEETQGEPQIVKDKLYGVCPACSKLVSINKANRKARKHTGVYQPTLWEGAGISEDEFFGRVSVQNEDQGHPEPVSAGSV